MLSLIAFGANAFAQRITGHLPNPDLQSVFPPGVRLGSSVSVQVAGRDLTKPTELRFSNVGLTATPLDEKGAFEVIAADGMDPGVYEVRVLGEHGLSTPRAFVVSDSSETVEIEPNDDVTKAQILERESCVSGRSSKAGDLDVYRIAAEAGQPIYVRCLAESIDSKMEVALCLRNARGEAIVVDHSTVERDGFIQYQPEESGDVFLEVRDMIHEGSLNHFYRLSYSSRPPPEPVFPPVVAHDSAVASELFRPEASGRIEVLTRLRRGYHTTAPSTRIGSHAFPSSPFDPILVEQQPVRIESRTNDAWKDAETIVPPVTVAGRFSPAGDRDWYHFTATKGQTLELEVVSQRLGVAADPFFVIFRREADQLKRIATADDQVLLGYDQNSGGFENVGRFAFNSRTDDPAHRFVAPETGEYFVMLRELNHTHFGAPSFTYRLSLREPEPDFQVVATAHTPVDLAPNFRDYYPYTPVLNPGGLTRIDLQVFRSGGFSGALRFRVENLPPGVSMAETHLAPDRNFVPLVLVADKNAKPFAGELRIVAEGKIDGRDVRRQAVAATVLWKGITLRDGPRSRRMLSMPLSVIATPPKLFVAADPAVIEVKKGETFELPLEFRRGDGFDGPVMITNIGLPKSLVSAKPITFAASESAGAVQLSVSGGAKPTEVTFCLDAKIDLPDPRTSDPKKARSLAVLVSSTPVTLRIVE
ncbi:MAG: hypothetical protein AAFU85_02925 [Planctomycetota bacterium]